MQALDALPDPIFILTESGRYVSIIGGPDRSMYHDGACLENFSLYDVMAAEKADWFLAEIRRTLAEDRLRIVEYTLAGADVDPVDERSGPVGELWFEGRIQPMSGRVDGERAVIWLARNNTRSHQLEVELRRLSETDELTGIWNRRWLMQFLDYWLANHDPETSAVTLLIIDIDHFKPINDCYGHLQGDVIIKKLIATCSAELDGQGVLARLGGEEFAVVLTDISLASAMAVAERLRDAVDRQRFALDCGATVAVTISIGVSNVRPHRRRRYDLLRDADMALFQAKREGRNRVVMAVPD